MPSTIEKILLDCKGFVSEESKMGFPMKQLTENCEIKIGQHQLEPYNKCIEASHKNMADNEKPTFSNHLKNPNLFTNKNNESLAARVIKPCECDQCELVFDKLSQLDYHKRSVHEQERSQICQLCGKGFFRYTDLKTHLNIHLGTNQCICEVCGRIFNHMSNLVRHSRTHSGVKPYACTICGKRFAQITCLVRHKAIHKRGNEVLNCGICYKHYKSDNGLKVHLRKSHGFIEKTNSEDSEKILKRQHYCKVCGESFQFVELLRLHEASHENLRTLECRSCNQEFKKTDDIKEHRCGRLKLCGANKISKSKKPKYTREDKNQSYASNKNETVLKQLRVSSGDSKELSQSEVISSGLSETEDFTLNEPILNCKLPQNGIDGSNRLVENNQTKETIVYVTTEQLGNMNTEQVVDTANHFLHEHLMELAAESSLQTENAIGRDCDGETVVSEMINSCWEEIETEMPNVNESSMSEKRDSPICRNNTQSIIYIHALDKDGLVVLNESGSSISNVAPDHMSQKRTDAKHDFRPIENSSSYTKLVSELQTKPQIGTDITEASDKQDRYTTEIRGTKVPTSGNYFIEDTSNDNNNLMVESTNLSLAQNMFDEMLKNNCDNTNAVLNKSENQEPTLRLVQTENGEQFYELLITNCTDKIESSTDLDRITITPVNENLKATQNELVPESMLKLVQFDHGQRVLELMQKNNEKSAGTENIELASNSNCKIIEASVLEDVDDGGTKARNFSQNKNEKVFYLAQNHKDNLIDFFEIETLGTQEQNNFSLISDEAIENVSQTSFNNLQTLNRNKNSEPIDNESCEELLGLIWSNTPKQTERMRTETQSTIKEEKGPMVRLVQNEDGAQFFELIRGDLEFDESQGSEYCGNNKLDGGRSIQLENEAFTINETIKLEADMTRKKKQKSNPKKYNCNVCEKSFSKRYNYRQHIGTHFADQQKFKCKECGTLFAWKSTLNKHMATHRAGGQQKFVCEICPKVYTTLSQVNEHVKRDHLKERNHKCTNCAKTFFKKFDLKIHMRTHTKERPYECRVCYKSFHHQSHIIRHERIHSGERPYACNICEKTFTQLGSLKNHRQRHQELKIDILDYQMDEDDPLPRTMM